jgi:hypothetical protein
MLASSYTPFPAAVRFAAAAFFSEETVVGTAGPFRSAGEDTFTVFFETAAFTVLFPVAAFFPVDFFDFSETVSVSALADFAFPEGFAFDLFPA